MLVQRVERRILLIRGQKVMLDSDLAELYGVETKLLNRAVKRNVERFPEDFAFQLTSEEVAALRCQFGTSNEEAGLRSQFGTSKKGRGGRRYRRLSHPGGRSGFGEGRARRSRERRRHDPRLFRLVRGGVALGGA